MWYLNRHSHWTFNKLSHHDWSHAAHRRRACLCLTYDVLCVCVSSRSAGSGSGGEPEWLVLREPVEEPPTLAGSGPRLQHRWVHDEEHRLFWFRVRGAASRMNQNLKIGPVFTGFWWLLWTNLFTTIQFLLHVRILCQTGTDLQLICPDELVTLNWSVATWTLYVLFQLAFKYYYTSGRVSQV